MLIAQVWKEWHRLATTNTICWKTNAQVVCNKGPPTVGHTTTQNDTRGHHLTLMCTTMTITIHAWTEARINLHCFHTYPSQRSTQLYNELTWAPPGITSVTASWKQIWNNTRPYIVVVGPRGPELTPCGGAAWARTPKVKVPSVLL